MLSSNINTLNSLLQHKNFSLLIAGYFLYIIHLILVMTDEGITYKNIIYEILVLFSLIALKEYQNFNQPENLEETVQPNEPVSSESVGV